MKTRKLYKIEKNNLEMLWIIAVEICRKKNYNRML